MDELITTSEAAAIAGVGVSSIKRWADQARIRIVRTPGGHRRVDKADLQRFLRSLRGPSVASSRTPRPAAGLSGNTHAPTDESHAEGLLSSSLPKIPAPSGDPAAYWADAMLKVDVYELQGLLLSARSRTGSWSAAADEAILGLREIGDRWYDGTVTVMEEHVASERLSRALATIVSTMPQSLRDPVCMLASVGGDQHTLGLSFLQVCLREAGWQSIWVGGATPTPELVAVAKSGRMDMIAMSASQSAPESKDLPAIAEAVGEGCRQSGTRLVLGGSGPWPEPPVYGERFESFRTLGRYLRDVG